MGQVVKDEAVTSPTLSLPVDSFCLVSQHEASPLIATVTYEDDCESVIHYIIHGLVGGHSAVSTHLSYPVKQSNEKYINTCTRQC